MFRVLCQTDRTCQLPVLLRTMTYAIISDCRSQVSSQYLTHSIIVDWIVSKSNLMTNLTKWLTTCLFLASFINCILTSQLWFSLSWSQSTPVLCRHLLIQEILRWHALGRDLQVPIPIIPAGGGRHNKYKTLAFKEKIKKLMIVIHMHFWYRYFLFLMVVKP